MACRPIRLGPSALVWDLALDPVYREVLQESGLSLASRQRSLSLTAACEANGLDIDLVLQRLLVAEQTVYRSEP